MNYRQPLVTIPLLFLLVSTSLTSTMAQRVEGPISFQLGSTHEFDVITSTTLVWQENQDELVSLNFTMTEYPTNESRIEVRLVQFFTVEDSANAIPESQAVNTSEISLTMENSTFTIFQYVPPPEAADRFYLNITINAAPIGGNASQTYRQYSLRFPQSDTILVERDNLVPVINLYGFPPGSFFTNWLPFYGSLIFIMLIPAMIYGVTLVQERRQSPGERDEELDDQQSGDDEDE